MDGAEGRMPAMPLDDVERQLWVFLFFDRA
jgi:hypothetical protein